MNTDEVSPAAEAGSMLTEHRGCIKCGYDLYGLPLTGKCPECGSAVHDSLRGILLQFAAPEYIASVRQGHSLVLNGILLSIVLMFVGMAAGIAFSGSTALMLALQVASVGTSILILFGYVKLTIPDPQFQGTEKPDSARQVVRIAVLVQVVLTIAKLGLELLDYSSSSGGISEALVLLASVIGFAYFAAWAVQFFGMMRYTRWLAQRVPDAYIIKRTRTYMWLLPVLATVGVLLVGLGPLIALVMYWNLLHRMRKHLLSIEKSGVPAQLPKMTLG